MEKIEIYRAEDGTDFEDENSCIAYEVGLKLKEVQGELFLYDCDGEITPNEDVELEEVGFIHFATPRAVEALIQIHDLQDYWIPEELRYAEAPAYFFYDYREGDWKNLKEEYERLDSYAEVMGARRSSFIFDVDNDGEWTKLED
jgi:hypothetical protein